MRKEKHLIFLLALSVILLLSGLAAGYSAEHEAAEHGEEIGTGASVPDEVFQDINGNPVTVADTSGKLVLLSFLYVPYDDSRESADSRSQLNFIRSMCTQYSDQGLHAVLVDAASSITGEPTSREKLLNYMYDWNMDENAVLAADQDGNLLSLYGVDKVPATFLIVDGTVLQRWDSVAYSSQLAFSITDALSGDLGGQNPETRAEAQFPGLPSARPLSEQIWLIDGGAPWPAGSGYGVKWAVINDGTPCSLRVTAENQMTGETIELFEEPLENISHEETAVLLSNMPQYEKGSLALIDTVVKLEEPGYYELCGEVVEQDTENILLSGTAVISVESSRN